MSALGWLARGALQTGKRLRTWIRGASRWRRAIVRVVVRGAKAPAARRWARRSLRRWARHLLRRWARLRSHLEWWWRWNAACLAWFWYRAPGERRTCPACGGRALTQLDVLRMRGGEAPCGIHEWLRSCGLVFANPLPTQAELAAYYAPDSVWAKRIFDRPLQSHAQRVHRAAVAIAQVRVRLPGLSSRPAPRPGPASAGGWTSTTGAGPTRRSTTGRRPRRILTTLNHDPGFHLSW